MNILIWTPCAISHGGRRLLANLLPAIARQEDIDLVRLVISKENNFRGMINTSEIPNVQIIERDGPIHSDFYHDCHVVYFNWPHDGNFYPVDRPSICTFQDTTVFDFTHLFPGYPLELVLSTTRQWLSHSTKVITSSNYIKSRLVERFGTHCQEFEVIPHAISPSPTSNVDNSISLSHPLPNKYIVYPSNMTAHKNHLNLFSAYAQFAQRKSIPLVLFGFRTELLQHTNYSLPSDMSSLFPHIKAILNMGLSLNEDYYVLGNVNDLDVTPIIKNAKALVMPSLAEGGGSYPVEEALRLGTPVLCSDIPVMREHLSRHSAQIVWFNPHDPISILKALYEVTVNYDYYKNSAVAGMNDPTDTWDDIAGKYIEVFRSAYLKYYQQ